MSELEELINNLDFENNSYFYHITSKGFGDKIINEGLYLEDKNIYSTAIKIPEEMIENPDEYCSKEYGDSLVKRQEMVIFACEKDYEDYMVTSVDPIWIGDTLFKYNIPSEHILGYVDLKDLIVRYNEFYEYGGRNV